jgi:hypothetical protein
MQWKPATIGEIVFLDLYRRVGRYVEVSDQQSDLEFLVTPNRFREFARLAATLEIFLRTVRSASGTYAIDRGASASLYGRRAREEADLPVSLTDDGGFRALLRDLGRVAHERRRNSAIERNILRAGAGKTSCYLCGINLVFTGNIHNRATVDHVWPLRFGGEGLEENLAVACKDCNEKKGHAATWAWGPVVSTYEELIDANAALNSPLRISLMLGRIMLEASTSARRSTLKDAAARIWPAASSVRMPPNHPHLYFECLTRAENAK